MLKIAIFFISVAGLFVPVCPGAETSAALAKKALQARDYPGAASLFAKASAGGDPEGDVGLGFMHHLGLGGPKDLAKAFSSYSKAADKKYPKGIYYLGRAYKSGITGKQDYGKALKLFMEAAKAGYPLAEVSIGIMYSRGEGVKADQAAALKWFKKAVKDRQDTAYFELGQAYWKMGDDKKTIANYKVATEKGDLQVASPLGYMFSQGKGVGVDYAQAVNLYKLSAKAGFSIGQYNLGEMYRAGAGVPADNKEALKWMLISEMSNDSGNSNDGLPPRLIPEVTAKLTGAEIAEVKKAADAEFLVYKANHDNWSAERFCRDESPNLPSKRER
ncbi:MAG TPA: tetratricopeptide repeat protein [Elusimicrobiales bacterium]|nr:tetratricopeptide repeat protein [Elusimicrobiales bacterium]